jgi:alginate O-acetyltransferase complex protein AlgI
MLFTSPTFIFLFVPAAFFGFMLLGSCGLRNTAIAWLTLASLLFYSWDDPQRLLPIIVASIAFNLCFGILLSRYRSRILLAVAIGGNLALLGYFKYAVFLVKLVADITGLPVTWTGGPLPIGISFFTFTQIAFLVDTFRDGARHFRPSFYPLFVTFFPHLVAGPIYHHKDILPQFERPHIFKLDVAKLGLGLTWFGLGLAKKVLLADPVAGYAALVFDDAARGQTVGLVDGWLGVLSFALQIYYDFSGYSDMAIGLALMIGIQLPVNFNSPYKATSVIEFWRRWHITLSQFLRNYLYIALGGNRRGPVRRYVNLLITMLLGGFWHGASWTFVVWGGIHGAGLIVNHAWRNIASRYAIVVPGTLAWAVTFAFVLLAWVPFRANSLDTTLRLWAAMVGGNGLLTEHSGFASPLVPLLWNVVLLTLARCAPNSQEMLPRGTDDGLVSLPKTRWAVAAGVAMGVALAMVVAQRPSEFLYFRF